ncbi:MULTISPECIES: hypothetical protein [unclassified Rhizobium]|uniref:hypothetical protein n=1 Tax=unclassified Rhizobium TaxID=2613769 RepID=UPI00161CB8B5|nr:MULTISPECIES: hypothetical protein [unclassified Rhizobium]MBB3320226.1 hypothetical protein [Rhizobium sp. BK181]MBB3544733.1 hypothetical protein [Rhizobium sp. BK399]
MINDTTRKFAETLFRAPAPEAGSNAEKLLNLRKGMQLRTRKLRDSERTVREAARPFRHSSAATRAIT